MYEEKASKAKEHMDTIKTGALPGEQHTNDLTQPFSSSFFDDINQAYPSISKEELSKTVVVVTGIPRSGTSMIMQMLQAGGLSLMIDNKRSKDENNPKGYFEFEPVKQLVKDNRFLEETKGKGIKIIPQFLRYLDAELSYRIIFIIRDINEVVASQEKMLSKDNNKDTNQSASDLKRAFDKQINQTMAFLNNYSRLPVLYISHRQCIEKPIEIAENINEFLGGYLDINKMAKAVSRNLYRQKMSHLM